MTKPSRRQLKTNAQNVYQVAKLGSETQSFHLVVFPQPDYSMLSSTKERAFRHAAKCYPNESCGLLVIQKGEEIYVPCRNMSSEKDQFVIAPEDYDKADDLGEIVGVVHSHPEGSSEPSQTDLLGCEHSGLPWFIVSYPQGSWSSIAPRGYSID